MYAIIHYAKKTKSIFPKSNMVLTSLILEVVAMILKWNWLAIGLYNQKPYNNEKQNLFKLHQCGRLHSACQQR